METISKSSSTQIGYLHLCRVSGDLYDSWAITESPEAAQKQACYGHEEDRVTDCAYPYDAYKITNFHCDRNGWSVYGKEVRNSRGNITCSRES